MALLSGSNLSKSFGSADIFKGVTLSVARGARIAIVGPNGIGKTTLLRILMGLDEPSAGSVQRAKNLSIGFLPQEADLSGVHSLWEECLGAFTELRLREADLASLEAAMSDPDPPRRSPPALRPPPARVRAPGRLHLRDPHPPDPLRPWL